MSPATSDRSLTDLEHSSVSSADAKGAEQKLAIAQTTIPLLEEKLKSLEV